MAPKSIQTITVTNVSRDAIPNKTDECLKARDAITVRDKVKSGLSRGRALGPQEASELGANMPSGPCKVR